MFSLSWPILALSGVMTCFTAEFSQSGVATVTLGYEIRGL